MLPDRASFLNSRPSHVQGNNHTVPLPTIESIIGATQLQYPPPDNHAVKNGHSTGNSSTAYVTWPQAQSSHQSPNNQPALQAQTQQQQHTAFYSAQSFVFLCRLAIIVSRLQSQVCTLMTPKGERLGRVLDIEKDVEGLLEDAKAILADCAPGSGGVGVAPGFRMSRLLVSYLADSSYACIFSFINDLYSGFSLYG